MGYGADRSDYWDSRFHLALSYLNIGESLKAEPLLNEVSEGGDEVLQQKAQLRIGSLSLEKQLKRLSIEQ